MAAFICRYCASPLEPAGKTVCECGTCGRLQSVPLIDSAEKRELLLRAEQLRREQRYDKAIQLYERMIALSPTDGDLYWALALCRYGVLFFADGGLTLRRTQPHSFVSDSDYQQALKFADEKQRVLMVETAALIDEKQRRISRAAALKCDVLLCSGGAQSDSAAGQLYGRLTSEGLSVFCPGINLKDTPESEREPYLFAAVNSARALVIAVTDSDVFSDVTAMNLCGRFIAGNTGGRAVIPVLYGVQPGALPPEFARFQALNAASLGFEQDLVSSVRLAVSGGELSAPVQQKSPLVRRAYIMLSDHQFAEAEAMCSRIEPDDPAEAALIRLLCEYSLTNEEALGNLSADIMHSNNYRLAMQHGGEAFRLKLKKYALSARETLQAGQPSADRKAVFREPESAGGVYSAKVKPVKKGSRFVSAAVCLVLIGMIAAAVIVVGHYVG